MEHRLPSTFAQEIVAAWSPGGRWHALFEVLVAKDKDVIPDAPTLEALLDVVFYASLTKEEGRPARFSIAIARPNPLGSHCIDPRPLTPEVLGKLSAACDGGSTLLLAWMAPDAWQVWGITVKRQTEYLIITARDPGSLSLQWMHEILFSYDHGRGVVADKRALSPGKIIELISDSLPPPTPTTLRMFNLQAIYRSMREHGRGGALLVVPTSASAAGIKLAPQANLWAIDCRSGKRPPLVLVRARPRLRPGRILESQQTANTAPQRGRHAAKAGAPPHSRTWTCVATPRNRHLRTSRACRTWGAIAVQSRQPRCVHRHSVPVSESWRNWTRGAARCEPCGYTGTPGPAIPAARSRGRWKKLALAGAAPNRSRTP